MSRQCWCAPSSPCGRGKVTGLSFRVESLVARLTDGESQVRRYALTGERFGAHEARRIGLVHEVVPLADLETSGATVVEQMLANGPEALAETKALAMESSFGGMSVEDDPYAPLVRIHAANPH